MPSLAQFIISVHHAQLQFIRRLIFFHLMADNDWLFNIQQQIIRILINTSFWFNDFFEWDPVA
jgi:hypothetical protein